MKRKLNKMISSILLMIMCVTFILLLSGCTDKKPYQVTMTLLNPSTGNDV